MFDQTDYLAVNTVRALSMDMIQKANSGHPGLPLGAAPMAYTLWSKYLSVAPKHPEWVNRDRFVLSAGHGSALLYSLLHLSGFNLSIDDLKNFRQYQSLTPGHPEVHHTEGVEATTGPLGQGLANAVGMAMAEAHIGQLYNRKDFPIMDHFTYALCGDGDLMEGVASEALSLAGHLKLGKLIVLYDSNDISLDGPLDKAFSEDMGQKVTALGWQYLRVEDGNSLDEIANAIEEGQADLTRPTLIEVKTVIGYGAPLAGTNKVHGAPLGEEGVAATREALSYHYDPFVVPEEVAHRFEKLMVHTGEEEYLAWKDLFAQYAKVYPEEAKAFELAFAGKLPEDLSDHMPSYDLTDPAKASRVTSKEAIQALSQQVSSLWGGSADLSSSNNSMITDGGDFDSEHYDGRNIWYGVREFAMGAALNGILLHGGSRSFVSTFFVFSDYLKPAIRVAALSQLPAIYVFTHDSIAVGEDGPTHEPIEQLAGFRAMPNLDTIRPADGNEVAAAWLAAIEAEDHPTVLALSRQALPVLEGSKDLAKEGLKQGAYVLSPSEKDLADGILIATGSEVHLALEAKKLLKEKGVDVSVVSMPSQYRFKKASKAYQESVLPSAVRHRLAIEMGSSLSWGEFVGLDGDVLAIDRFGSSGSGSTVVEAYGFTAENIAKRFLALKD
ncbi:transketolase [Atopobacter sp. AH10]|uniref:transketolase n=1 Tax=Atopobacter sp. AH10 TaxID=2315861 RepID=UPI000EF237F2|nr:transketolase [Atopobacter sp. AH10]RLK62510.1 transketolase [Atopobacter sp. AH10]